MASPEIHEQNNDRPVMKLDIINPGGEENEGSMNHYSDDSDSPSNSPISHTSSILGISTSASNFSGSTRRSSSSSSGGCSSGSTTEEEEDDNGCLDDWEAIADALAADDTKNNNIDPNLEPHVHEPLVHLGSTPPEPVGQVTRSQAWRPDDVFRPQCLPNLLKQNSFLTNLEGHYGQFGFKNLDSPPSNCPICCEDLDLTDSSFLPCPCGYRLCLFCHKRILEDDGRCPGCRKYYDHHGNASLKLGRSCNMIHRH